MKNGRCHSGRSGLHVPENIHPFKFVAFVCTLAFVILSILYVSPFNMGAQASGSIRLSGHVPGLIYNSQMLGPTDPNTPITLMVGLRLRNAGYLQVMVDSNARPYAGSAERHLSAVQFAQDYGPLPESQDAVIAYMQSAGFKVNMTFNHRLLVGFKGSIGLAEKTFRVQVNNYLSPGGRKFYAPTSDPSVPSGLAAVIQSVVGLDTAEYFTHASMYISTRAHTGAHSNTITCPGPGSGYYLPNQIATAYNLAGLYNVGPGFHGEGQRVALFELDDYLASDINAYINCFGNSSVTINRISINGGVSSPSGGAAEVELDMELVLSAAPDLASLQVYEAPNGSTSNYIAEWSQIVSDAVPVVSTSWGGCESTSSAAKAFYTEENVLFTTAAAQGQSILADSGFNGSNDCGLSTPAAPSVDDPASQPYVTGVGGTSLTINNGSNTYNTETTWHDSAGASGGGVSKLWSMPAWQQGPGVISSFSSPTPCSAGAGLYCREVPDVSIDTDPSTGYVMYCTVTAASCNASNPWIIGVGRTAASPMWAAMIALANQKSVHDGNGNLGFLNPLLYKIDENVQGTSYTNDFHDVRAGNNDTTGNQANEYPATQNYDMATGLGSYNALNLATDLETLAKNPNITPTPTSTATTSPTASVSPTGTVSPTASASPCTSITPVLTPMATISPTMTPTPTGTPCASPTPSPSPTTGGAPVSKMWYFAEGKVGSGFTEYLTFENPDDVNDCAVNIEYLLGIGNPVNKSVTVPHASRFTESVNSDLDIPANSGFYQTDAAIVTVNSTASPHCMGIVAERPMYFTDFAGVSSGSDVMGSTQEGKTFYFADVPTGGGYSSFITILNPGTATANITASYDVGGTTVNTQTLPVPGMTRGTIIPTNSGPLRHAAVVVTSDQPVVVERPDYFSNVNGGNAQTVSGATSVVGVQALKNDWLFAEGYTGSGFQEYLVLANFSTSEVTTSVMLEFSNGHTETVPESIPALGQAFVDVNAIVANRFGICDTNPCQSTQDVSAEITSSSSFIAEREMYFHYTHIGNGRSLSATGGTDVIGEPGPASATAYSFAEGYTNVGYDEWLTLQNPTAGLETLNVILVNEDGRAFNESFTLVGHSRFTVDITGLVMQHLIVPNDTYRGYEVSMVVQSSSGAFVAERPMYWDTGAGGTQGGSDVGGYLGG